MNMFASWKLHTILASCLIAVAFGGGDNVPPNSAQSQPSSTQTSFLSETKKVDKITLFVKAPRMLEAGRESLLEFKIENAGQVAVAAKRSYVSGLSVQIIDARGEQVQMTSFGNRVWIPAKSDIFPTYIDPGQSYAGTINLSRIFDLSETGHYKMRVSWRGNVDRKVVIVELAVLEFEVEEPSTRPSKSKSTEESPETVPNR